MSKPGGSTVSQTVDPRTQQYVEAMRQYALGAANQGQRGLAAVGGDANALNSFIQPLNPIYDELRQRGISSIGDAATQAGAYGGGRQGVVEGQYLADTNRQQIQDAMQRAMGVANLGFGGLPGAVGPYGRTEHQQTQSDPFSQLLGLGLTAGSMGLFGPLGAGAGALFNTGFGTGQGSFGGILYPGLT